MKITMKNLDILIAQNKNVHKTQKIKIHQGIARFVYGSKQLDLPGIHNILMFISSVHICYPGLRVPIHLEMGSVTAVDKLAIIMLETIIYTLMVEYKQRVTLNFKFIHTIFTECIKHSPLRLLGRTNDKIIAEYKRSYCSDITIDHFRRIVSEDAAESGKLSVVTSDIQSFLKHHSIDETYCKRLAEVISELIGNSTEHSRTTCLVDIDISSSYYKRTETDTAETNTNEYLGVNVSIISCSEISFEDGLRRKISDTECHDERYAQVQTALINHSRFFSQQYLPSDFYRIAAFQDRISGRSGETKSGGTGLTTLLDSLEKSSEAYRCYLLAGERILHFDKRYLDHNENGWIGFNACNDFINSPPAQHILERSSVNMPGVAYNLWFVCRKEEKYEENRT